MERYKRGPHGTEPGDVQVKQGLRYEIQQLLQTSPETQNAHTAIVTVHTPKGERYVTGIRTASIWEIHGPMRHGDGTPYEGALSIKESA